ncbi:hypothetical protein A3E73_03280 [Candidatus Beckwithbacteria bacterium RIFCSPHIGHO2_12_FULL_47_17]|uniref:Uncharacterized protein n=2 Tax=Microgenomates group TaxID=1794810 RepID=A0A1F5DL77_9BACT|nr:MAG: hypothetical protein A3E73_03280 [Candidatus Beckwithbacteria bacterium RIFCSPHIGHO2_12_FULL_47_17]
MVKMKKFKKLIIAAAVIIGVVLFGYFRWQGRAQTTVQAQTSPAETGTLVVTVTASGQVSSSNNTEITTQASGVVKNVYVGNGEIVTAGQKIAELELDLDGKQRSTQAWSSYQSAKNALETAKYTQYTLRADMLGKWDSYKELSESDTYKDTNSGNRNLPEFYIPQDNWLAAEAKYKNQTAVIAQTQTALSAAWLSYQQSSATIYAPISGTVTGLSLQPGIVLLAQSTTTGSASSQKIASIKTEAPAQLSVNLSEIDVTSVQIGNPATITLDAFPGKTFAGKVISVDTIGTTTSGVTTYPAVIALDTEVEDILPNMAVSAAIITATKDNVLLVPSTSIQTQTGQSAVKVVSGGQTETVTVETGVSSDSQIEIVSGLSEGDEVVTNPALTPNGGSGQTQTRSVFGGLGGGSFRAR